MGVFVSLLSVTGLLAQIREHWSDSLLRAAIVA